MANAWPIQPMAGRQYDAPLLAARDAFCRAAVARMAAQTDFNKDDAVGLFCDEVDFAAFATMVGAKDSQPVFAEIVGGQALAQFSARGRACLP